VLADRYGNLLRPGRFDGRDRVAGGGVTGGHRRTDLVDRLQALGQVGAAGELVQDDRPGLRDEQVARRIAGVEDLHVACPGGIADVDRVEQHARVQRAGFHLRSHAAEAIGPDHRQIDRLIGLHLIEQRHARQI
jgi:hypothetical protein